MQLFADYFPLILFFVAFKWQGIMVATAVAIVASIAQIAWFRWKGNVSVVHWLSFAIIVVFGGATLILQDAVFIKWKPTVLYCAFGLTLLVGKVGFNRDLIGGPVRSGACASDCSRDPGCTTSPALSCARRDASRRRSATSS